MENNEPKVTTVSEVCYADPAKKLKGEWIAVIKPSLWHWSCYHGYFKLKWWHYLLPPWFPPRS